MDPTADIREFLTTRRAKLTPAVAGLPGFGGRRRVPGLRREEVSLLAGISVEYYVRLERGNATGISDSVLDGISRALQLNQAEDAHLRDLVHAANQGVRTQRRRPATRTQQVSAGTQRLLDAMSEIPAIVQNGRMDIVATNPLGRALFSELFMEASGPPNLRGSSSSTRALARHTATGATPPNRLSPSSGQRRGARHGMLPCAS